MNKQTHRYREQIDGCQMGRGLEDGLKKEIKKYKLPLIKKSQGCKVQYGEYSQYCHNCAWCQMGTRLVRGITFKVYKYLITIMFTPETNITLHVKPSY